MSYTPVARSYDVVYKAIAADDIGYPVGWNQYDHRNLTERILCALADEEEQLDWNVIDDPAFYKGLFQRWKSEVRFQVAKVDRYKQRLEDIRELLRTLERNGFHDADKLTQLHQLVFN